MLDRAASVAAAMRHDSFAASEAGFEPAGELLPARPAELLAPLSGAFDLAEAQSPGHAARVAHIAVAVARQLGLDAASRRVVLHGALLHDAGVAVGELPPGVEDSGGHTAAGAWVAGRFGFDERVQEAIRCSHERWDGEGRPRGLAMTEVPLESLIISAAHWATDLAQDDANPLQARAHAQRANTLEMEPEVGPRVAAALGEVLQDDVTWMALWDDALPSLVARPAGGEGPASVEHVEHIAAAMGEVVDASLREAGRSRRVATLAVALATGVGMPQPQCRAVGAAAALLDIGQLGVPRHINEKPAILSLDEMELVRRHPGWGARIIEQIPGMVEIARWVEAHHERPDGRGYAELLEGEEVPLASRILAVADSYWALRAARPYRDAFNAEEAMEIIHTGAGVQHDRDVVALLGSSLAACQRADGEPGIGS